MTQKTIGMLGGTGTVGREAVHTLLSFPGYNLLLGSRDLEKGQKIFGAPSSRLNYAQVDLYNREQLNDFCGKCDLVLNCAGPAKQITHRVARAALEQEAHYVDVSGDEALYQQISQKRVEIEAKKRIFVISAGVYPGLSEIFPAYVAQKFFDELDLLEVFFAGQGSFSLNAAYDIVCSIEEDTGMGMTYCKKGQPQKIEGKFHCVYSLPEPAGKLATYPILIKEFAQMAKQQGIKAAYFYNTYQNKKLLNSFMMIKALQQYKTTEEKMASAQSLIEEYSEKKTDNFTMFHLRAEGLQKGEPLQLEATLLSQNDWNTLSGIVAAQVARLVIEEERPKAGCYYAAAGIEAGKLIEALAEHQVQLKYTFSGSLSKKEGEICK